MRPPTVWQRILFGRRKCWGYCIHMGNVISEFLVKEDAEFKDALWAVLQVKDEIELTVPEYKQQYIAVLEQIAEFGKVYSEYMFSVLNYRRVIEAYLLLKSTYYALPDGKLVVLIHGRGGEEQLAISVKEGKICVEETKEAPQMEFTHLEAMNFFFGNICTKRKEAPVFAQLWFPLPLCH